MRKVLISTVPILFIACSQHPPEIHLSCTGYVTTLFVFNGQIDEKKEPKIVSFSAKAYLPLEKNKNPYNVRIEGDTYDSSEVDSTADYIMGRATKNSIRDNKQNEYNFHLNRKTGVMQYTERRYFGKTGQITNSFEGNCTKLEKKI
jgi:hypothetical protein